jgi:hypothetical protein
LLSVSDLSAPKASGAPCRQSTALFLLVRESFNTFGLTSLRRGKCFRSCLEFVLEAIKFFRIVKSRILKNYGVTGIEVTLNIADQMQVNHAIDRIDTTIKNWEETGGFDNDAVVEDFRVLRIFLNKLALKDTFKPTIFEEEKENEEAE